jgi:hypothetical protein
VIILDASGLDAHTVDHVVFSNLNLFLYVFLNTFFSISSSPISWPRVATTVLHLSLLGTVDGHTRFLFKGFGAPQS